MARAVGKGLRYFPKDVDYYMDDRIMDLLDAFGPLGQTVYDVMLSMVYREGYYLEMAPDRLARQIIRWIGSRWVGSREAVVKVLDFIAEVGLIDEPLYRQGVITSAAIQRRYDEVAARRKTDRSKYWLLGQKPAESAAETAPIAAECAPNGTSTVLSATETHLSAAESAQRKEKETRVKETKENETRQNEISKKRGRGKETRGPSGAADSPLSHKEIWIILFSEQLLRLLHPLPDGHAEGTALLAPAYPFFSAVSVFTLSSNRSRNRQRWKPSQTA